MSPSRPQKATIKLIVMIILVLFCLVILHLSPLRQYISDIKRLQTYLQTTGAWAPFIFIAAGSLLVALGAPRLLYCSAGGLLFGFIEGLLFSQVGSLIGSYATFLFARWGGGDWLSHKLAARPKVAKLLSNPSFVSVAVVRQMPVSGIITNILLGMAVVSHCAFIIGSIIGFLPGAVVATLIGSGFGKESSYLSIIQTGLAVFVLAISAFVVIRIRKKVYEDE